MDSIWLWPLGLVAFLLAWPALRAVGVRLLSGRLRTQALTEPPDHIGLARVAEPRWRNPLPRETADRQLTAVGFAEAGVYVVHEMPELTLALYAHPAASVYAVCYDHPRSGFWAEFVTRYEDGTLATFTTLEPMEVDIPTGSLHVAAPHLSLAELWKRMLVERPRKAVRPCDRARAARDFEQGYAESVAWHKRHQTPLRADAVDDEEMRQAA